MTLSNKYNIENNHTLIQKRLTYLEVMPKVSEMFDDDEPAVDLVPGDYDPLPDLPRSIEYYLRTSGQPGNRWITCSWPRDGGHVARPKLWKWRILDLTFHVDRLMDVLPAPGYAITPANREKGLDFQITEQDGRLIDLQNVHLFGRVPNEVTRASLTHKLMSINGPVGFFNDVVVDIGPARAYRCMCQRFQEPFSAWDMFVWRDIGPDWTELSGEDEVDLGDAASDAAASDADVAPGGHEGSQVLAEEDDLPPEEYGVSETDTDTETATDDEVLSRLDDDEDEAKVSSEADESEGGNDEDDVEDDVDADEFHVEHGEVETPEKSHDEEELVHSEAEESHDEEEELVHSEPEESHDEAKVSHDLNSGALHPVVDAVCEVQDELEGHDDLEGHDEDEVDLDNDNTVHVLYDDGACDVVDI